MKKFVLIMLMVGLIVSPVWAGPKQDTIHQDILNQIEVLQGDNASQTTTLQNAINGIPTTDLTPVLNAVTAGEANVIANDNLNTQTILDAVANAGSTRPALCGIGTEFQRFVAILETDEVCDNRSGVIWPRVWSRSLPGADTVSFHTATATCVAEGRTLASIRDWTNLYIRVPLDFNLTGNQTLDALNNQSVGFEAGPNCVGVNNQQSCNGGVFWTSTKQEFINNPNPPDQAYVFQYTDKGFAALFNSADTERAFGQCVRNSDTSN